MPIVLRQAVTENSKFLLTCLLHSVIMSCQDYYNCYFRKACGLKTVKLLLVRSAKLNFQLPNVELVYLSNVMLVFLFTSEAPIPLPIPFKNLIFVK